MTDDDRARAASSSDARARRDSRRAQKRPSFAVVGVARANRANGRRVDVPEMDDRESVSADADGWIDRDGSRRRRRRADARANATGGPRKRPMMTSRASSPSCETSCETSVARDEVLGRGRTSVVTRARASGRMVAVAVKRVRVDDGAVAAQVRMEMRVLSRAMRRDRARVGGGSSSAALTATVKDGGGDARGSDSDDDARSTQSTSIVRLNGNEDKDEEGEYGDDGDDVDRYDGIVKCLGFGFHDASNVAFIRLEMMTTGSLEDVVRRGVRFESSPRAALCVVRCLANALAFLHDVARVVHRDVKPNNVLFDETGACKLCDFGLCAPADAASSPTRRLDGTVVYMSPERLASSDPRCGPESDVWGVGVTVLESVLGRPPFDIQDGGPLGLVMQIVDTVIDVDACVPGDSVDALVLRRVLTACLVKDHRRRVSVRELRDPNDERWDLSAYTRADVRAFVDSLPEAPSRPGSPALSSASASASASDDEHRASGFSHRFE